MRLGNVTCGVKIVGAWTEAETIHFRVLNRETRAPVKAEYIDEGTGKEVDAKTRSKATKSTRTNTCCSNPRGSIPSSRFPTTC
ncbi:Ku protein [Pseudaminobacter soli (ex Li et al. 2025)]